MTQIASLDPDVRDAVARVSRRFRNGRPRTSFQLAYEFEAAATAAVRHLWDLEIRSNRRYRLWERPAGDPAVRASTDRLMARREAAIDIAEEAEFQLGYVWDRLSRAMPPLPSSFSRVASLCEMAPAEFWRSLAGTGAS
jgi:hypothetical protein